VSLRHLWAFLAIALPVLASLVASLPATDLAYHLRAGSEILSTGAIPTVDSWTFTANGQPWFDQQWGAQVLLEATYRTTGWTGLAILRAALVGVVFGIVYLTCVRQGLDERRSALLAFGAFVVAAPALALRPQLFAMVLFAVTLLLVVERHDHPRRLWLVPLLAIPWANVHGSFFLAPAVLGLAWLADLEQRAPNRHLSLIVAAVTVLACCLTPFGPSVWAYAVGLGANPEVTKRIIEWQPTTLRDVQGVVFFASALLVAAFLARRGRATPWSTLAWLGFFLVIGAYAVRGIAWWPLAAVAAVANLHEPVPEPATEPAEPRAFRMLNGVIVAAITLAAVALLPIWRPVDAATDAPKGTVSYAPSGITEALGKVARNGDRILNPQPWGSWFEFAVSDALVAIDSRIELFPPEVWADYERVMAGVEGWEAIVGDWGVTIAVVDAKNAGLHDRLTAAGWTEIYSDDEGAVLRSNEAGPSGRGSTLAALLDSAR
jgi:hypothetical protein